MHNQQPWASRSDKPCLVTYNPISRIDEGKIIKRWWFQHIVHDVKHVALLMPMFRFVQGRRRTWHCGAHTLINSQETCFVSGLAAARQMGADYPFERSRSEEVVQLLRAHDVRPALQKGVNRYYNHHRLPVGMTIAVTTSAGFLVPPTLPATLDRRER